MSLWRGRTKFLLLFTFGLLGAMVFINHSYAFRNPTAAPPGGGAVINIDTNAPNNSLTIGATGAITAGTWQGSAIGISYGGTGATTQAGAINALLPSQTGQSGKFLTTADGINVSWATSGSGAGLGDYLFSDGSDGDVIISANTTLTTDMYYNSLTINSGVTLNPNGWRIAVKNTLTLNGIIARDGNNGGSASGSSGGTGGAALGGNYMKGGTKGGNGGGGSGIEGGANCAGWSGRPGGDGEGGISLTSAIGSNGAGGASGGSGGSANCGSGGGGGGGGGYGNASAPNTKIISISPNLWHLGTLLDILNDATFVKYDSTAGTGGGGGGGGGAAIACGGGGIGGGGGGSGSSGGFIAIYARTIIVNSTGSIEAKGGNGGNGSTGGNAYNCWCNNAAAGGGGAGGSGGSGGTIILVYKTLTNSGTISTAGGSSGLGAAGGTAEAACVATPPTAGNNGNPGNVGKIYFYQI